MGHLAVGDRPSRCSKAVIHAWIPFFLAFLRAFNVSRSSLSILPTIFVQVAANPLDFRPELSPKAQLRILVYPRCINKIELSHPPLIVFVHGWASSSPASFRHQLYFSRVENKYSSQGFYRRKPKVTWKCFGMPSDFPHVRVIVTDR